MVQVCSVTGSGQFQGYVIILETGQIVRQTQQTSAVIRVSGSVHHSTFQATCHLLNPMTTGQFR